MASFEAMSVSTRDRYYFWTYLVMKPGWLIDMVTANILKILCMILKVGPKSRPFLIHQPTTIKFLLY